MFSSLETTFSRFLPIPKVVEDQTSRNIRRDLLKTNNKPNEFPILPWNQDLSHMRSDFSPFFHFLQRFLSMEYLISHTNPTNQSYLKVHPGIFFLVPRSTNWWRRLKPHSCCSFHMQSFPFWWLNINSFPDYGLHQFNRKKNSQGSKHSKKSSHLATPNNKPL